MSKKSQQTYQSLNQGPPYLTPASLTTEPLLPWLITSWFINEISSWNSNVCNFIDLPIEVLDCSRTFCVCSIRSLQKMCTLLEYYNNIIKY